MIDHEVDFGWLQVGQRVYAVVEDGRTCVVVRLPSGTLGVDWGDAGGLIDAMPENLRVYMIPPDDNLYAQLSDLRAVREQLRAVTAERDQAQEDAVVVLDAYGHRGFVSGEVMNRVDRYKAAWVQRKSPPPKQVP